MKDLPEPLRTPGSPQEEAERRWKLLVFSFTVATAYAVLHKLLIPLGLKLTPLSTSPYAKIDWWFVQNIFFLALLRREQKLTSLLCWFAGMSIAYGAYEVYETAIGRNPGWLAFSRLLSSVPIAGICVAMMSQKTFGRRLISAWQGAIAVLVVVSLIDVYYALPPVEKSPTAKAPIASRDAIPSSRDCGAQTLSLFPEEFASLPTEIEIVADSCGFRPARLKKTGPDLWLSNQCEEPVNFHLVAKERGRLRTLWNMLVPAHQRLKAPPITMSEGSVAMIYSDNHPISGVVAIVMGSLEERWSLTRSPLTMQRVP